MKRVTLCFIVALSLLLTGYAKAGSVSGTYFPLAAGTEIDLTAEGTLDWIKFGNGEDETTSFFVATKIGNPVFLPGTLSPLGTPDEGSVELIAFTGEGNLNFTWGNGNFGMYNEPGPVDTVVTETITPGVSEYPLGIGASFDANAAAQTRVLDVYVQAFNADMLITAELSGGAIDSIVVEPTLDIGGNDFALGFYRITYSGVGETLTISVLTQSPRTDGNQAAFANAGFFAATVTPEPSTLALGVLGLLTITGCRRRR